MNIRRTLFPLTLVIAAASSTTATPPGVPIKSMDEVPIPVSFRITANHFVADGKEHQPPIVVEPALATFTVGGVAKATQPGSYSITLTGTGRYAGSLTAHWRISPTPERPPIHVPKKAGIRPPKHDTPPLISPAEGNR